MTTPNDGGWTEAIGHADPDESSHMGDVNVAPTGPSMANEMEILRQHLDYDESTGTFHGRVGDGD